MKRIFALLLVLLLLLPSLSLAQEAQAQGELTPRQDYINRMITSARELFDKARGRAQPAASSGSIYVCKNFTTHIFRLHRDQFQMAEFPGVGLVIPDNLPAKDSKPWAYGISWMDIPADKGNPFVLAAEFRYDTALSKAENREKAREFLKNVQRGDFFQMSANYYYGVGAHSLIFTEDYNPETDSLTWTDSNMKGQKVGGVRHGYVQFDAVKEVDWFVDAFCQKTRGASIYRLRDDIEYRK